MNEELARIEERIDKLVAIVDELRTTLTPGAQEQDASVRGRTTAAPPAIPNVFVDGGTPRRLPLPPDDDEKYQYVVRGIWNITPFFLIGLAGAVFSMIHFGLLAAALWIFLPVACFVAVNQGVSWWMHCSTPDFNLDDHDGLVESWRRKQEMPDVDLWLPVCGENLNILRNSWSHVAQLDYPRERLHVLVLDDGGQEQVREMAAEFGFAYESRADRGWMKKAGNLNHGYQLTNGEFISILDADYAPRSDYLRELLPYFSKYPDIGIVQSPQYFLVKRTQTWIERGLGASQEFFYRAVQPGHDRRGNAMCVGTNAVYRRSALDANGGITMVEHSEDIQTGFDLGQLGWRIKYIPIVLATGLCPDTLHAFLRQQYRWCAGATSLVRSAKFWRGALPWRGRACYIVHFTYYLQGAIFAILGPAIPLILIFFFPSQVTLRNYAPIVPLLAFYWIVMPMWHRSRNRGEAMLTVMAQGWAYIVAIWDVMRGELAPWIPVGSRSQVQADSLGRPMARNVILAWYFLGTLAWIGGALYRAATVNLDAFLPMLLLGVLFGWAFGKVMVEGLRDARRARSAVFTRLMQREGRAQLTSRWHATQPARPPAGVES